MYQKMIREIIASKGHIGQYEPRHILGYMYLEHNTLDGLSRRQMEQETMIAIECINAEGVDVAEGLAVSFGL